MKRKTVMTFITAFSGLLIVAPLSATLVSCSSVDKNRLVYGNFESYMNAEVERYLQTKYDVTFDSYETNEQILSNLKNDSMDIVTPSTYMDVSLIKENLIQPLNWSKFKLGNINNVEDLIISKNPIFTNSTIKAMSAYGDLNGDNIIVPYDSLFNNNNELKQNGPYDIIKNGIKTTIPNLIGKDSKKPGALDLFSEDSLLNWTVPYFLQDNIFAYRGPEIKTWGTKNKRTNDKIDWLDILYTMSHDSRFYKAKTPNLGMVDDSRTIYSIPRLMQDENKNVNPQSDAPGTFQKVEIKDVENTYKLFVDNFRNSPSDILLNSDSSVILNKLSRDEIKGGIMYNGDVVYSVIGGDDGIDIKADDIHYVRPEKTLAALDTIAFNKNLKGVKLDAAYNIVGTVMFDSIDSNGEALDAGTTNGDDYKYWSTKNFDAINYTPVTINMYDFATSQGSYAINKKWENDAYYSDSPKDKMEKDLLKINVDPNMLEQPLNDISKSNMQIAYYSFKNNL